LHTLPNYLVLDEEIKSCLFSKDAKIRARLSSPNQIRDIKLFISHIDMEKFVIRRVLGIIHIFIVVDIKDKIKHNTVYSNIDIGFKLYTHTYARTHAHTYIKESILNNKTLFNFSLFNFTQSLLLDFIKLTLEVLNF